MDGASLLRSRKASRRRFLAMAGVVGVAALSGRVLSHGDDEAPMTTWPIHYAGAKLNLGNVTFPASCPQLPTLRVNEAQPVNYAPGWWRFDVTGIYYWKSSTSADDGLVLIRSFSRLGIADMVLQVVAASASGATGDNAAFYADQEGETLKLLTDPGPRDWNCGPQASAMVRMLGSPPVQIQARVTQWLSAANGAHQNTEVHLSSEGGWTLYDAHFGLMYMPGFDGLDLYEKARAGEDTRHYIRDWQPETPWHPTPWHALQAYEMGFGLWVGGPVPIVAAPGVTEAQIEAALGEDAVIRTAAQMRASYY